MRAIRELLRNTKGSVAMEAAVSFPILGMMLLATIEFSQAYIAKRKTEQFAGTVADLIARTSCVTQANLDDIAKIGPTILAPYNSASLGVRISSLIQNGTNTTVQWSYASGSLSSMAAGANVTLPGGYISKNQTVILAETSYGFTPTVSQFLPAGIAINATSYYYPRLSSAVSFEPAC